MGAERQAVIDLYKTWRNLELICVGDFLNFNQVDDELLYMGRDYPQGYDFFRSRLKKAFQRNSDISDPEQIKMLVKRGEFVVKEIEALYMLKKYRTLKDRYSTENDQS